MPNTATVLKKWSDWKGEKWHVRLDPPLEDKSHVVVSSVNTRFTGPETYIFPADSEGEVTSWGEMEGSFRGDHDHARALRDAGYEVKEDADAS